MVRKIGFEPTLADWCALRSDRSIRCSTLFELLAAYFCGWGCNPISAHISHFTQESRGELLATLTTAKVFAYQRPTLLGICKLTTPYHTYDLSPPIVKSYKGCTPFLFILTRLSFFTRLKLSLFQYAFPCHLQVYYITF